MSCDATSAASGKPGGLEDIESAVREVAALQQSVTVAAAVPGASLSNSHGVPNARSVADLFAAQQPVFGDFLTGTLHRIAPPLADSLCWAEIMSSDQEA